MQGLTENDSVARLNFPTSFSNINYVATTAHYGTNPVALTIIEDYRTISHIPILAYDAYLNSYGSAWGIVVFAIGT